MEEEKNGEQGKNGEIEKRKGTGEQYLYALIRCAEWVDKPYKMLVEKNKTRPEVMKELYLCACDSVPVEKAIEAQEKNPPESALRFIRQKHLENTAMDEYQEQIAGIKRTTVTLEKEVRQMSGMLKHIVERVPDFDSMFPGDENEAGNIVQEKRDQDKKSQEKKELVQNSILQVQDTQEKGVPEFGTAKTALKVKDVMNSGTKKESRTRWLSWGKKNPANFIEKSLDAGYTNEQLDYLLDCMEEGVPVKQIERFSSPRLPVEVMRRLRSLEERKETEKKYGTGQRS